MRRSVRLVLAAPVGFLLGLCLAVGTVLLAIGLPFIMAFHVLNWFWEDSSPEDEP